MEKNRARIARGDIVVVEVACLPLGGSLRPPLQSDRLVSCTGRRHVLLGAHRLASRHRREASESFRVSFRFSHMEGESSSCFRVSYELHSLSSSSSAIRQPVLCYPPVLCHPSTSSLPSVNQLLPSLVNLNSIAALFHECSCPHPKLTS